MRWNLRLAAANRGIWQASQLQRLLAERGLVISAGKMSGLWSGSPISLKLADLDVICAVLGCEIGELLIPEPDRVPRAQSGTPDDGAATQAGAGPAAAGHPPRVVPRRRDGRSVPPA
jgi:DNA-binding Xre family transcriptional regulator